MWEAQAETQTRADPAKVWALWENPERWKDWNEQIASARLLGPFTKGTKAKIRFRRQPRTLTFTITAIEPGVRFTDETRLPGVRLGHEHMLEPGDEATIIRHRLYFDGPAARIYALLMGGQIRRSVAAFPERERELVEGAAG